MKGDDTIFGFEGDDIIRGGKGDDYLDGGFGSDFIVGGFGKNTFADQKDGDVDILLTRLDRDASQADIIENLDERDKIFIAGTSQEQLSTKSIDSGIGIYNDGILEAIYTGGNLTTTQIDDMLYGFS